jgi:hypothetical protein
MNKMNTSKKSDTLTVMMVHVMVFQVKTLCCLLRGMQRDGKATMKTEVGYSSATLLTTHQTTQNIAI